MNANEVSLTVPRIRLHFLTIFLGLIFFGLVFYFRNNLSDFTVPFIIVFLGVVLIALINGRFETYILVLLIINSTVFQLWEFPIVPIFIGDLYFSDLLIITLILGQLLKRVTVNVPLIPKPLGFPIFAFICAAIFSFVYAVGGFNVTFARAGVELRSIFHFFLFFLVIYYIKNHKQLNTLLFSIAIVASISALLLIVQYILGLDNTIVSGRQEVLSIAGSEISDVTRVLIPGTNLIFFTLNSLICLYFLKGVKQRGRLLLMPVIGFLALGIVLTFTRSLWGALLISAALILFFERRRVNLYPRIALIVIVATITSSLIYQTKLVDLTSIKDAVFKRTLSIVEARKNFRSDTMYMRLLEYRHAWSKIKEHPLLGIGLGNSYRQAIFGNIPYEKMIGGTEVHNSYLAVQLKMGLPGTIALAWLIFLYFRRTMSRWRQLDSVVYKAIVLGIMVSMFSFMFQNLLGSLFLKASWVSVIAVGMGITERIFHLDANSDARVKNSIETSTEVAERTGSP